jgi:predicted transcriptional regulator
MMPYTTELVTAVMARQNVPKEEFASFVGDIHRAMIDITFQSIAIADSLGVSVGIDVSREAEQPAKPARGASVSSIVQSLLRPKETLFEPPVPHSVRVPSVSVVPPPAARDFGPHLPRKLSSIEEALTEDYIICLEDGKMVKDLEEYLRKKGLTPQQYRAKWKLPPEYPMIAPNALLKRGVVHEMDPVSGKIVRARI